MTKNHEEVLRRAMREWSYANAHDNELPEGQEPVSCDLAAQAIEAVLSENAALRAQIVKERGRSGEEIDRLWAKVERLREKHTAYAVAASEEIRLLEQRVEGLLNQNQEIAKSNADHVGWHREAEARVAALVGALDGLIATVYGGSPAGLLTAYNAAKRVIASATEPERQSDLAASRERERRLSGLLSGCEGFVETEVGCQCYPTDPEKCLLCQIRAALAETGQEEGK